MRFRVSEKWISIILRTKTHCEISVVTFFETVHVSPCRSTVLLLSSCDKERASSFLEHSGGSFIHEAMEENMTNGRHLEMRNIFSLLDDPFSMIISLLKGKLLLAANPKIIWF